MAEKTITNLAYLILKHFNLLPDEQKEMIPIITNRQAELMKKNVIITTNDTRIFYEGMVSGIELMNKFAEIKLRNK